jgi:hypothetical protein
MSRPWGALSQYNERLIEISDVRSRDEVAGPREMLKQRDDCQERCHKEALAGEDANNEMRYICRQITAKSAN